MSDEININESPANLHPAYRRASKAAQEQSKRSSANQSKYLDRVWAARGKDFPFRVPAGQKQDFLALSEMETHLVHSLIYNVDKYPSRENFLCRAWKLDDDANRIATGDHCPFCVALGDPRAVSTLIVGTFDKFERKDGEQSTGQARVLIATQEKTTGAFCDLAASDQGGGSLKHLLIRASRPSETNSCRVGESFTIHKDLRGKVGKIAGIRDVKASLATIKINEIFGPLTPEEMLAALRRHKQMCDENPGVIKRGYNESQMNKALGGADIDDIEIDDSNDSDPFADLDDIEDDAEETKKTKATAEVEEEDDDFDWEEDV